MLLSVQDRLWLFVLLALFGCSTAEAPVDYSAARGVLITTVAAPLDETWVAAREALESLQLRPYDLDKGAFSAVIVGDTPQGQDIRVNLKTVTRSRTEVSIRILDSREREPLERIRRALIERL